MYEADKYKIIEGIDNLIKAVEIKLLPAFSNIEEEAKEIEDKTLEESHSRFNPETMDPSQFYEDAYFTGVEHYLMYTQMKNDFLNMTTVWLYHLFEQDCNKIFTDKKWKDRKAKLTVLLVSSTFPSNFYKINEELQHICDINKHGEEGADRAKAKLLVIRPDLFDSKTKPMFMSNPSITTHTLKNISLEQLIEYAEYMKLFWNELYEASQSKKSM